MTFGQETKDSHPQEPAPAPARRRRRWIWLLAAGLVAAGVYLYFGVSLRQVSSQTAQQGGKPSMGAVPVVAAAARKGDIAIYLTGLGSVVPLNTVTIKSRVDGQLMKVFFQEGQIVKAGDPLVEIDPRPYQAQLTQAEGQLVKDQALLENAHRDLERYQTLSAQDSIAKQQYDTQKSLVHQMEGQVQVDQGQVDNARLQLVYSHISAPVGGLIGLRAVDAGNIVHATDTNGLAVITQLQPITVIFTIPEDSLPDVLAKLKANAHLTVEAYNRSDDKKIATGSLMAIDSQIDPTTGTIKLRATFPNENNELFPNQFVNARLLLDTQKGATIMPIAALQRGPQGAFVFLVKADQTVTVRPITPGPVERDDAAVDKGLSPGDLVVVDGTERLREGTKVEAQIQGAETPAHKKSRSHGE